MAYRKVRIVFGPIEMQAGDKSLVPPTAGQFYLVDKTTVATVYSDEAGTALTNSPSVPTGVATGAPGLDAYGNFVIYGDPGVDYTLLVNSVFLPVPSTGIHGKDFTDHTDGTIDDPHNYKQWALATFPTIANNTTTAVLG